MHEGIGDADGRGNTSGYGKPKKFTDIGLKALAPGSERKEHRDPDCRGLCVVIHPTGRKSFAVRYRFNGKSRKLTLPKGSTLAQAHAAAAAAWAEVEKDRDPSVAKREKKQAQQIAAKNTFKAGAESYLEREAKKKAGERLRSLQWRRTLLERLVYPTLGDQPIAAIKRKAVIELLDKIEDGKLIDKDTRKPVKGGAVMAHSTLAVVRRILNWYAVRDEDYRSPIMRGMARIKPDERARSRVLADDELRAVWKTLLLKSAFTR